MPHTKSGAPPPGERRGLQEFNIPRRVQMGYVRLDPLRVSQEVWKNIQIPRGMKVPDWYCIKYGTSPWMLSKKNSDHPSSQRKALAFIVRMNYISDLIVRDGYYDPTKQGPLRPDGNFSVRLRYFRRTLMSTISGSSRNSWGHSPFYEWRRVLSCTLRRFVDLASPALGLRRPSNLLDRLRSTMWTVGSP